ncbi:SOSS complex subunit C isoform X1 [Centruroides vittatus]|uniref:SOSS complex subunit C isoform X1 n=1 Tax=Centruroides vittatus TaxID=120091 RepID=UPI0035102019
MAFQPPSSRQEIQNRKILEELQQHKKQLMLKQQSQTTLGTTTTTTTAPSTMSIEAHALTSSQRAALQQFPLANLQKIMHAHANSVGYFITQDSSFGNLILPVLPRLEK